MRTKKLLAFCWFPNHCRYATVLKYANIIMWKLQKTIFKKDLVHWCIQLTSVTLWNLSKMVYIIGTRKNSNCTYVFWKWTICSCIEPKFHHKIRIIQELNEDDPGRRSTTSEIDFSAGSLGDHIADSYSYSIDPQRTTISWYNCNDHNRQLLEGYNNLLEYHLSFEWERAPALFFTYTSFFKW